MNFISKMSKASLIQAVTVFCAAMNYPTAVYSDIPESSLNVMPPMTLIYHPVSTTNRAAQESFDRGLTYIFAFNHDIAFKSFENAARLDPNLAMAYWGMALALGQNINQDVTPENEIRCYEYAQTALQLSPQAAPVEQAYIKALVQRYTNDPNGDLIKLRFVYRDAMKKVAAEFPEDLDAATLYAESILDLSPWKYWTLDGKPKPGTMEASDVLESVMRRNPLHIGANHYYIHVWEASPYPERALMSAYRLTTLNPESGHLLHMPCHIFMLVGNYEEAIKTNSKAISQDRKYIQENGMGGEYPLHYLSHNITILAHCYMLMEDYPKANQTAMELIEFLKPYFAKNPHLYKYLNVPLEVALYFHRWNDVLAYSSPFTDSAGFQTFWHFSRAVAYANLGNLEAAQKEKALMEQAKKEIPEDEEFANNPARNIYNVGEIVLNAALARAQKQEDKHLDYLYKAVAAQDQLFYDEPPAWYLPLRIQLGQALLQQQRYKEAEAIFTKALNQHQRNGRLLFGLFLSLKGQNRIWDTFWVQREMTAALKYATQPLTLDNL